MSNYSYSPDSTTSNYPQYAPFYGPPPSSTYMSPSQAAAMATAAASGTYYNYEVPTPTRSRRTEKAHKQNRSDSPRPKLLIPPMIRTPDRSMSDVYQDELIGSQERWKYKKAASQQDTRNNQPSRVKLGLQGFVNGRSMPALADTGSRRNVISLSLATELGVPVDASSSQFRLGNSKTTRSIGSASLLWSFAENPMEMTRIVCDVLPTCTYDLILGSRFLRLTETMSKYKARLTKCIFSMASNILDFRFLGETSQRLQGVIGEDHPVLAMADSGADGNIMDLQYAIDHGFCIKRGQKHRRLVRFADGSIVETEGQVETHWTFVSGERIPMIFEVLKDCCLDVVLGEQVITEHSIFEIHSSSLIMLEPSEDEDYYELAPFDFINSWQQKTSGLRGKMTRRKGHTQYNSTAQAPHDKAAAYREEQRLRDLWNYRYDFGSKASQAEISAEMTRRRRFDSSIARLREGPSGSSPSITVSQVASNSPILQVPSIPGRSRPGTSSLT